MPSNSVLLKSTFYMGCARFCIGPGGKRLHTNTIKHESQWPNTVLLISFSHFMFVSVSVNFLKLGFKTNCSQWIYIFPCFPSIAFSDWRLGTSPGLQSKQLCQCKTQINLVFTLHLWWMSPCSRTGRKEYIPNRSRSVWPGPASILGYV